MAHVFVINEPFVDDFCRTQRWAARTRGRVLRAPDWLAYVTAVLEQRRHDVRLFDFPARNWGKKELKELLERERPEWVVYDATTPSIYSDIECAQIAKDACGAKVIMVGPHCSSQPEEVLRDAKGAVDVVCLGEYDYTVGDVIEAGGPSLQIPGIAYLDRAMSHDGVFRSTGQRPSIEDLDAIPFPAWHHLDLMDYFDGTKLYPYIDKISGRGCPFQCTFCVWPQVMHGHRVRLRSPGNVVDEIERDIGLCPPVVKGGEFFFEDDTFTLNQEHAISICEEIIRRKLKIRFSVNARVDCGSPALFKALKAAGCRELLVGFESGDDEVLRRMKKAANVTMAREFMHHVHDAGLDVHGCFVLGSPGETEQTMQKTIDFALGLGLNTLQFSCAAPYPGTRYFKEVEKNGLLRSKNWEDWLGKDGEQGGVVDYPGLDAETVEKYVDQGLRRFYFRPQQVAKFLLNTETKADLYRKLRGMWNFGTYLVHEKWTALRT